MGQLKASAIAVFYLRKLARPVKKLVLFLLAWEIAWRGTDSLVSIFISIGNTLTAGGGPLSYYLGETHFAYSMGRLGFWSLILLLFKTLTPQDDSFSRARAAHIRLATRKGAWILAKSIFFFIIALSGFAGLMDVIASPSGSSQFYSSIMLSLVPCMEYLGLPIIFLLFASLFPLALAKNLPSHNLASSTRTIKSMTLLLAVSLCGIVHNFYDKPLPKVDREFRKILEKPNRLSVQFLLRPLQFQPMNNQLVFPTSLPQSFDKRATTSVRAYSIAQKLFTVHDAQIARNSEGSIVASKVESFTLNLNGNKMVTQHLDEKSLKLPKLPSASFEDQLKSVAVMQEIASSPKLPLTSHGHKHSYPFAERRKVINALKRLLHELFPLILVLNVWLFWFLSERFTGSAWTRLQTVMTFALGVAVLILPGLTKITPAHRPEFSMFGILVLTHLAILVLLLRHTLWEIAHTVFVRIRMNLPSRKHG